MSAGLRVSNVELPTCIRPEISSTVSRPLVTNHLSSGESLGLLISMRLLSKYWTSRVPEPSGASAYASTPEARGAGPQVHDRATARDATGWSLRSQTVSNAESAKGMEAGSRVGAAPAGLVAGVQPRVNNRVAIADSIAIRWWDVLLAFVISARILSS